MKRYTYWIIILISCTSTFAAKTAPREALQKPAGDNTRKAPVTFKCRLNYFIPKEPSQTLPQVLKDMNTIDLNIRNEDHSRIIQELEYEIYTTDKQSGIEVDQIRRVDRAKIKAGEVKERRSLSWKPDSIAKKCDPPTKCRINLRIVRIKYDDGSEWQGQVEAEKDETTPKK